MSDYTIKQGDTWPPLHAVLSDADGPINLATADRVDFKMLSEDGTDGVFGACEVTNATGGEVRYLWADEDLESPGSYRVEFQITWVHGGIQTVPNANYGLVVVVEDLDVEAP